MRDIDGTEFLYGAGESMAACAGDTVRHCDYRPTHDIFRPVKAGAVGRTGDRKGH